MIRIRPNSQKTERQRKVTAKLVMVHVDPANQSVAASLCDGRRGRSKLR